MSADDVDIGDERKLFLGPRLRRLRRELGITQARMAEDLGVSPSYVNLLERNQRPLTAQVILRLAEAYELDVRSLSGAQEDRSLAGLNEVFSDNLFRDLNITRQELRDAAQLCPSIAEAMQRLYGAYIKARRDEETLALERLAHRDNPAAGERHNPIERASTFLESNRNHFPELDAIAEQLHGELAAAPDQMFSALGERLRERHGVRVRVMPVEVMPESLRRYHPHRKQLLISELLSPSGRIFQAAFHIGLAEGAEAIDKLVRRSGETDFANQKLLRITLANYFAGALMMPYGRFYEAAESLGYDITVLCQRFGASFEQVCHRLTTMQRPTARGVPFFMIRVDNAGNVSKRLSSVGFHFSRYGGTCPLWNVHSTFKVPNQIFVQVIEMPEGTRYFSIARTVRRAMMPFAQSEPQLAIGLGCELKHADRLVYSRGLNLDNPDPTPIGINCRLCERPNCSQRAEPPASRPLLVDETVHGISPFGFVPEQG
jgi:predicted transcriptional regulator/transcriptional regulator with XRE-family HTH domain